MSALESRLSRRKLLTAATVGGAGLALGALPADATGTGGYANTFRLTVLGTTHLHGNVYNWVYFRDTAYSDSRGNQIGLAKAATLIKAVRAERGAATCITLDAGDTIQARRSTTTTPRSNPSRARSSTPWPQP